MVRDVRVLSLENVTGNVEMVEVLHTMQNSQVSTKRRETYINDHFLSSVTLMGLERSISFRLLSQECMWNCFNKNGS